MATPGQDKPALASATSFYKRPLPEACTAFASPEGKELFAKALQEGNLESYFVLAPQAVTQNEPAYCALGTLVQILNSLEVDPMRRWKSGWRWYDQDMLDCCRPLSDIAQVGLTLSEFACLARCNGLRAQVVSPLLDCSPDEREKGLARFRDDLRAIAKGKGTMALSYSRKTLGQTGDGHFSPIGALCEEKDMVLILDVARFKYPSYWVPVELAYESMFPLDKATGQPRGYVLLSTAGSEPGSLDAPQTLTTLVLNKSSWASLNSILSRTLLEQTKSSTTLADLLFALLASLASQPTGPLAARRTETASQAVPSLLDALATTRLAQLVPFASAPKPNAVLLNLVFLLAALAPRSALSAMVAPTLASEFALLREEAISTVGGLEDEVENATKQLGALALVCLAAFVLLSHFRAPWSHLAHRLARPTLSTSQTCSQSDGIPTPAPSELSATLESLLTVPANEVGRVAFCASLRNEGRFINEWLLYYRVLGVDRFYLYDSGSDDDTLLALQPWLRAGTVQLHRFRDNQEGHYQTTALDTCSRTYGPKTEWLVEADCDEFLVVVPSLLSTDHSRPLELSDMPDRPLWTLLDSNWLYKNADAVVVSRLTWKNAGFERLPDGVSLLALQTLREYQHSVFFGKLAYTKSILHTGKKRTGWSIPGAHFLRNPHATAARIVTPNGHLVDTVHYGRNAEEGLQYEGKFTGGRIFEPLVLYHYVQRDLQDCYAKLRVAHKLRKGGWRDTAGKKGCKRYDVYEDRDSHTPIYDQDGFYGAATTDRTMADSWFGRFLPLLLAALHASERDNVEAHRDRLDAQIVDPHPELVAEWVARGFNPVNGMPLIVAEDA